MNEQKKKQHMLACAICLESELRKQKAGAQLALAGVKAGDIVRYGPAGFELKIATLQKGGGSVYLYFDTFSGHHRPHFYYGFYSESEDRIKSIIEAARKSLRLNSVPEYRREDTIENVRFKNPLPAEHFDRVLIESYGGDGYYCGVYTHHFVPLTNESRTDLISNAVAFILAVARFLLLGHVAKPSPSTIPSLPKRNSKSEVLAIAATKRALRKLGYKWKDMQRQPCSYDLSARHKTTGKELLVEVKGTSGESPYFVMTAGERRCAADKRWRLAVVTNATQVPTPKPRFYTREEMDKTFEFQAWTYQVHQKKT
jgi:hypothetical protein